jgi:cyclopropane-fatty-acyl-phospholipid synthase
MVAEAHYDLGNDFFAGWLDPTMTYSCAYWGRGARSLEDAQLAKLALIADKLELSPGMRVLEIGCGWGGLARFLSERHGVEVTGITVSREQLRYGQERCAGLPVSLHELDYRDVADRFGAGSFDRVVSIEMLEAVGVRNYDLYMERVHQVLKPDGLFLLQTIGGNRSMLRHPDRWIEKYIFPNGMLPSLAQLGASIERRFVMEDCHGFGPDYDRTLVSWGERFVAYARDAEPALPERFTRMWRYYLLCCAAAFRARSVQLWQVLLSKNRQRGVRAPR